MLERATDPLSVADVALGTGLHVNTTRFHLDRLVAQGRAERHPEQGGARGRPRILYAALPEQADSRSHRLLAEMLAGVVSTLDAPASVVTEIGRATGRRMAVGNLDQLDDAFGELGFDQTHQVDPAGIELQVRHCPFLDIAGDHPDVVCTLHRGLLEGAVENLPAPLAVVELHPFATPGSCTARLAGGP